MKPLLPVIIVLLFSPVLLSQEKQDTIKIPPMNHIFQLQEQLNEIDFYLELKSVEREMMMQQQNGTIWLWTYQAMKQGGSSGKANTLPEHIASPLYRQYLEDSKFNPFKAALGVAEAGAVGYLAYKSIKKYGLFP